LQSAIAAIRFLAVIRNRLHVAGLAGRLLLLRGIRRDWAAGYVGRKALPLFMIEVGKPSLPVTVPRSTTLHGVRF
jgi:hypothetical protein